MNIAAISIHVQGFGEHKLSFLCDKCPRVQLLGSMLAACLVKKKKKKTCQTILRVAVPFYILIISV